MSTNALNSSSSSSSSSTTSSTYFHRKKSDAFPLESSKKADSVFQITLTPLESSRSTALPPLPPPRIPASDVIFHDRDGSTSNFSTLTVPPSRRGRSHSASTRSPKKQNAPLDHSPSPNQVLYTLFTPSASSTQTSTVPALLSDSLSPIRVSRQRSNSVPDVPESSGSSTSTPFVAKHFKYSRKNSGPNLAYVLFEHAEILVREGQPEKAEEVFDIAIKEDSKSGAPWAELYIRRAALQSKNLKAAQSTLDSVINGKNFNQWEKIAALVQVMLIFGPSQDYGDIVKAYNAWREAKVLIRAQVESIHIKAYLGHFGKIANKIRLRKEAIEGAGTSI